MAAGVFIILNLTFVGSESDSYRHYSAPKLNWLMLLVLLVNFLRPPFLFLKKIMKNHKKIFTYLVVNNASIVLVDIVRWLIILTANNKDQLSFD